MKRDDESIIAHGYPPEAHRTVCIDFDGVLYPFGYLFEEPDPIPGAAEAVRRLKAAGYRIVIFTSRLSPYWLREARYTEADQREYIERILARDGIPWDDMTGEKVPAEAYIDDRAIRFSGDWPPIVDWLLFTRAE